ncbi:MAG: sigma-70 family RNA polymerase sigma factor [Clostridia bacterium]|nr:sigma-70 family RNA polymerase sigma factor [Clostridia bacterium]
MSKWKQIEELYSVHKNIMFAEAYGILQDEILAEDAVGEAFFRIVKNIDKIKMTDSVKIRSLLVIVCRNVAINMYNKRKREYGLITKTEESIVCEATPEDIVIDRESVKEIAKIILEMEPIYKDVMIMSKFYNINRKDIAQMLGITEETVTKRLQRAKAHIKKCLERSERND